tara:strand:- start:376 stop:1350 length:975 start_codon:yes stop_codon:yes gene_type:complete
MNNILVTGGAGYIGSQVANLLLDRGHKVTIIDSLVTGNKKLIPKKAKFIKCDIGNKKKIKLVLKKNNFDAVMHFAGLIKVEESFKKPKKYDLYNFKKAKIFLKTCIDNNLKTIIFSSTASIYGETSKKKYKENSSKKPSNPYAKSKLKLEKFLIDNINKNKIKCIILRYFNVAGADKKMRGGLIDKKSSHLIKVACEVATGKRGKLIVNGDNYNTKDGTTIRDFIHVMDLANIHILSLGHLIKTKKSEIFNCGYGKGYSVMEVVKTLNKVLRRKIPVLYGPRRKGDLTSVVADVSKIKKTMRWKPKFNKLELIIKSSLSWEKKL